MITTDLFLMPVTMPGIIYGLFAEDEPLQIRYIGQSSRSPEARLSEHLLHAINGGNEKNDWINALTSRGVRVGLRVLGEYPLEDLKWAEIGWIAFWSQFCLLVNSKHDRAFKTVRCLLGNACLVA